MVYRLIALVAFCVFGAVACAENVDIATHQKGNVELFEKYFQLDKTWIADSYISLSINAGVLSQFRKKECKVFAYVDYVLNESTSFSVRFDALEPDQLVQQKVNVGMANEKAVIALQLGNVKNSCGKDMKKEKGQI